MQFAGHVLVVRHYLPTFAAGAALQEFLGAYNVAQLWPVSSETAVLARQPHSAGANRMGRARLLQSNDLGMWRNWQTR